MVPVPGANGKNFQIGVPVRSSSKIKYNKSKNIFAKETDWTECVSTESRFSWRHSQQLTQLVNHPNARYILTYGHLLVCTAAYRPKEETRSLKWNTKSWGTLYWRYITSSGFICPILLPHMGNVTVGLRDWIRTCSPHPENTKSHSETAQTKRVSDSLTSLVEVMRPKSIKKQQPSTTKHNIT